MFKGQIFLMDWLTKKPFIIFISSFNFTFKNSFHHFVENLKGYQLNLQIGGLEAPVLRQQLEDLKSRLEAKEKDFGKINICTNSRCRFNQSRD